MLFTPVDTLDCSSVSVNKRAMYMLKIEIESLENNWQKWKALPEDVQDALKKAFDEAISEEDFVNCPKCKNAHTKDCDEVDAIQDRSIGLCMDCGHLFCLACKRDLSQNLNCKHWEICETCIEADENLSCEIGPAKCTRIVIELDGIE